MISVHEKLIYSGECKSVSVHYEVVHINTRVLKFLDFVRRRTELVHKM
jgi:hypothetical protein